MNRKEIQKIETELETLTSRRDKLSADLASAIEAETAATEAIASGAAVSASHSTARGVRAVLQDAYAAIVSKIEARQKDFDAAQQSAEKASRAENYEAALKAYDAQTLKMARRIKEFATGNAAEIAAFAAAQSAVGHCEREMIRAGERRVGQNGALQFRRDCGDVRPILSQLDDFLNNKTYVTLSAPDAPVHAQDLSKAGIN
jgi:chromosome segregation ATPase